MTEFLNQVSAAEGLHRITIGGTYMPPTTFNALRRKIRTSLVPQAHHRWFNDLMSHANNPTLAQRLSELASQMPHVAAVVTGGDTNAWIQVVKKIRNFGTHLGDSSIGDGSDLHWLAESVFNFTRMSLFLRLGVALSKLEHLANEATITFTADRCAEIVQRKAATTKQQ